MTFSSLKLVAALTLLPMATSTMASANGGTIHFVGSIVEPTCTTSMADGTGPAAIKVNVNCERRGTFDVAFQRVGPNVNSPAKITLTRDGKQLGSAEAAKYRMALQGQTTLGLAANKAAPGTPLDPVIMTITYQ